MLGEFEIILDLFSHHRFIAGLVAGMVGLFLLIVTKLILRRRIFGWGIVFVVAVGLVLIDESRIGANLLLGLGALAIAGMSVDIISSVSHLSSNAAARTAPWVFAALVAWGVFGGEFARISWTEFALPLAVVGLGIGLWGLGRLPQADLVGPMLAIGIAGAWATVPETDDLTVMLGVAIPLGLGTLRPFRVGVSAAGGLSLAALFTWLIFAGGVTRPWTIAASWFALATVPGLVLVLRVRSASPSRLLLLATHLLYVIVVTRVADYTEATHVVLVSFSALITVAALVAFVLPSVAEPAARTETK